MKIILFGSTGRLGRQLRASLAKTADVVCYSRRNVDIRDFHKLSQIIQDQKPDIVVNAAAFTDVDRAEKIRRNRIINKEGIHDEVNDVNNLSVGVIAEACRRIRAALIHFSTDYVFSGRKNSPYTEKDIPYPINYYGATKYEGEKKIISISESFLILRTSWLYDFWSKNFLTDILKQGNEKETIRIITNEFGSPTWTNNLAHVTTQVIGRIHQDPYRNIQKYSGIYHVADLGIVSRYKWAKEILRLSFRYDLTPLLPISLNIHRTSNIVSRPQYSALDCDLFQNRFKLSLVEWKDSLHKSFIDAQR